MKRILLLVLFIAILAGIIVCPTVSAKAELGNSQNRGYTVNKIVDATINSLVRNTSKTQNKYSIYWQYWSQAASKYTNKDGEIYYQTITQKPPEGEASGMRSGGCRIVAQAKLLVECGAVNESLARTGVFNPDVYLEWMWEKGYVNGNDSDNDGVRDLVGEYDNGDPYYTGDGMMAYAKTVGGVILQRTETYILTNDYNKSTSSDRNKIMEMLDSGYFCILESPHPHQAYVGRQASIDVGEPVILDSAIDYSYAPWHAHTLRGTTLEIYTKAYFYKVVGASNPTLPTPTLENTTTTGNGFYYVTKSPDAPVWSAPSSQPDKYNTYQTYRLKNGEIIYISKFGKSSTSGNDWAMIGDSYGLYDHDGAGDGVIVGDYIYKSNISKVVTGKYTVSSKMNNATASYYDTFTSSKKIIGSISHGTEINVTDFVLGANDITFAKFTYSGKTCYIPVGFLVYLGENGSGGSTSQTYTITYNANGGTGAPATLNYSNVCPSISTVIPTKAGYTFKGWATSASSSTVVYDPGENLREEMNLNLYAVWEVNSYKVTFNANGGTTPTASKTVTYNSTYGTLPTPTRTGYTFTGWYTAASGGTRVRNSTTVSITANQTIYAQWTANTYTVTFNANGGTTPTASKTVTYDSTYGTLPTLTRTNYSFDGWYTAASGGTRIKASSTVSVTANQTLYAHWTAKTYTVTFDANGGTTPTTSKTVTYDSTYGTLPEPTRTGYTFAGWYTTATGGTRIKDTSTVSITANQTLYAHWTAKTYTVTFNANGGTTPTTSKTVTYDSTYGTLPEPTRTGYTFAGWYTTATGGGNRRKSDSAVTITANQTLYARWNANSITFIYHSNGGNREENYATWKVTADWMFPDSHWNYKAVEDSYYMTRTGYTATGYYAKADGSCMYEQDHNFTSYADICSKYGLDTTANSTTIDVYAQWTPNNYTVTFDVNGGTTPTASKTVVYDSTYGNLPLPTREGYMFAGWFTSNNGGSYVSCDDIVTDNSNHTLYSRYYPAGEKVRIYANVDGVNTTRGTNDLIVFNSSGTSTKTNQYGCEIVVDSNGVVTDKRDYIGDASIPENGLVLSGHDEMRFWLKNNINVGDHVAFDLKNMQVIVYETAKKGDLNKDGKVDANDAIYLLYNVFFGDESYSVDQPYDFDGDPGITANDAIYLLYHVFFGAESYPIQ